MLPDVSKTILSHPLSVEARMEIAFAHDPDANAEELVEMLDMCDKAHLFSIGMNQIKACINQ